MYQGTHGSSALAFLPTSLGPMSQLSSWSLLYTRAYQPPPENSVSLTAQALKLSTHPDLGKSVPGSLP